MREAPLSPVPLYFSSLSLLCTALHYLNAWNRLKNLLPASTVYKLTRKVQTGEKEKVIFMQFYAKKLKLG